MLQNTEYRIYNTEYRIQNAETQATGTRKYRNTGNKDGGEINTGYMD